MEAEEGSDHMCEGLTGKPVNSERDSQQTPFGNYDEREPPSDYNNREEKSNLFLTHPFTRSQPTQTIRKGSEGFCRLRRNDTIWKLYLQKESRTLEMINMLVIVFKN